MRFSPSGADTGHPVIFAEAFLRLTPPSPSVGTDDANHSFPHSPTGSTYDTPPTIVLGAQLTLFTAPHDLLMRPMTELSAPDFRWRSYILVFQIRMEKMKEVKRLPH
ncbi:hypothetical protein B296_00033204 [Ensete ventricosum]|uniref:Uncharacterized protein n=1 Tax=Ensete ventricosum TaxID=4639 RepID=A0A426XJ97_ENSVE|nr:hypothetical protein B296_00033204 [Ensete ventricosum]